jgi:hypothetical protein
MSTHDQEEKTGEASREDVTVSNRLLEEAREKGHDPEKLVREVNRVARELAAWGPRGPRAATSTTWGFVIWLLLQTALLLAALVIFWNGDPLWVVGERHLFLLVLLAGMLGSSVAALLGVADSLSDAGGVYLRELFALITLPVAGAAVALIFYSAIRGGLLAAPTAGEKTTDLINPFGVVGIAALVGLFLRGAVDRLKVVSTALFGDDSAGRAKQNR